MFEKNVPDQVKLFDLGIYGDSSVSVQIAAGWFDWFCEDKSLRNKTINLYGKVKSILKANEKGKRFDPAKTYLFFKNNCPMRGHLYDSISLVSMETREVIYWITPRSGHQVDNDEAQVCSPENGFTEPIAKGQWKDIVKYFEGQ